MSDVPVFVKIDDYKEVLDVVDVLKSKLSQVKSTLDEIYELKAQEDQELIAWEKSMAVVEQKLSYVDKVLFNPDQ